MRPGSPTGPVSPVSSGSPAGGVPPFGFGSATRLGPASSASARSSEDTAAGDFWGGAGTPLREPSAKAATTAAAKAPAVMSDLGLSHLRRLAKRLPPTTRTGSDPGGLLAASRSSRLASSRALSMPARDASAREESFPARAPLPSDGSWQSSPRAARSAWRFSGVASAASVSPHSTGRSSAPCSTCGGVSWRCATPSWCRSATTAARAAIPAARSAGSLRGRVAQVSELTNSVCRARPPSAVSTISMKRTSPGWSRRWSRSASRSISAARSTGTCLTAISRSSERLTVTAAMAGFPPRSRCHSLVVNLQSCTYQ